MNVQDGMFSHVWEWKITDEVCEIGFQGFKIIKGLTLNGQNLEMYIFLH